MSKVPPKYPFAHTRMVRLLRERISALASRKTQREIAAAIGYDKPNALSMYKRGEAKVPLARLPALARALEVDEGDLFRAWFEQEHPGTEEAVERMVAERIVTASDRAGLTLLRTYLAGPNHKDHAQLLEHLYDRFAT